MGEGLLLVLLPNHRPGNGTASVTVHLLCLFAPPLLAFAAGSHQTGNGFAFAWRGVGGGLARWFPVGSSLHRDETTGNLPHLLLCSFDPSLPALAVCTRFIC